MNFENNLFISYAHIDNEPLTPGEKGWVSRFHTTLKALLSMRLGRTAKIWRDEKLQGNDVFSDEIVGRFRQSAALVSIVTSRYLNSEWCTREAREFCQSALQNGGLRLANKSRLFKIIKNPVDNQEALPAPMREVLGYDFFTEEDGAPLELDPVYGQAYGERYNKKVGILAYEISQLIKTFDSEAAARSEPQASSKPAVYLAECGYDRKQARELLDAELRRLGHAVLPDQLLPTDQAEYIAAVDGMLARCALAIHLVGERGGVVLDGPTAKSIGVLQNEAAVARCKSGALKRLIWLPQGTRSGDPGQQAFIDALHQDAEVQFGADLITGDIELLRGAIHNTLKKIEQPEQSQPERDNLEVRDAAGDCGKLMYFILDEKDRKASVPLRKFCRQSGFQVALPAFEGDASQIRKNNQQLLENCDVVLLFYGAGDEAWKTAMDSELKKMAGYRGSKPPPTFYTYLAEPRTNDKDELIDLEEAGLINGLGGFVEETVAKSIKPCKP
jgi:hypothetical protein